MSERRLSKGARVLVRCPGNPYHRRAGYICAIHDRWADVPVVYEIVLDRDGTVLYLDRKSFGR